MTTTIRVALVLFGVMLFGGIAATIVPTHPQDEECGTWVFPALNEDGMRETAREGKATYDEARSRRRYAIAREASDITVQAYAAYQACDSALSTRRTLSIALLIGAVVVPGAVVFIGRSRTA